MAAAPLTARMTPVIANGTAGGEILIGGLGDDSLSGGGGVDVLRGGAGDDTLAVGDPAFRAVDGGSGIDTLALSGGFGLDLTDRTLASRIDGIERIDLGIGNAIGLDRLAVLNEAPASGNGLHVLTVAGTVGDGVFFRDEPWDFAGTVVEDDVTFDRYVFGDAELRIEQGVGVSFELRRHLHLG